jgi:radical SAM protein with 4Fe4S-binding SPASM domain
LDAATAKPRVSALWRLRNDKRNLVAYECAVNSGAHSVLSPLQASIIPLFDGTNTLTDIKDACFDIYDAGPSVREQWAAQVDRVVDDLMSIDGLMTLDGPVSPSLRGDKEHLFPNFADYRYPAARLERPLSVVIAFTNRCTCNCVYCYAERGDCPEMDLARWREVFDELAENEVFIVDISGGDLFARSDALEILGEMVSRDFTFFVSTKSLLSERDAERLAGMGIGRDDVPEYLTRPIQVSVDSADAGVASALVGHPWHLERATQTVENLVRAGSNPIIKGVLTSRNADAPEGLVRHFADLGVTEFQFAQYGRSYYRHDDALFLSLEQKLRLREIAERLKTRFPELSITIQDNTSVGGAKNLAWDLWYARSTCSGGRSKVWVKPNGDVTLCDQVPHNDSFTVGNVFSEGVLGVWRSQKLLDFLYPPREKFAGTVCFDCPEFDECHQTQGYCYRNALFLYGTIYEAAPECPRQHKIPLRDI